ncbi:MAG: transcription antitermination factor NusB [Pseudomonadota bacterium]
MTTQRRDPPQRRRPRKPAPSSGNASMRAGLAPRRRAAALLSSVLDEKKQLAASGGGRDDALTLALVRAALRHLPSIDAAIDARLRSALPETARPVRRHLQIAAAELRYLRTPPHAVVDCTVALVKERSPRMAGLANAICRRLAEEGAAPEPTEESAWLDTPPWLRQRLEQAWPTEAKAIALAHTRGPTLDLTVKPGVEPALPEGFATPTGSYRVSQSGTVSTLPGFEAGDWWVQDAAASVPATLLDAQPGERVLDLCAAPGGKTLQLAVTGAEVTALDNSEARMTRVRENLERTGLAAKLVVADGTTWRAAAPFDAILLDAPCTATGTLRRHPDLPYLRDDRSFEEVLALQERLLEAAWSMLKPGGRLVYCVCSLLPEEGEGQIAAFLARHRDAVLDPILPGPELPAALLSSRGMYRTLPSAWPENGGLDGFFAARLGKSDR